MAEFPIYVSYVLPTYIYVSSSHHLYFSLLLFPLIIGRKFDLPHQ